MTSTINAVGLKALKRPELQKLAKTHGVKANLKTEAMIAQLLARFPGGVPLDVIKVEDDVRVNPADEGASQGVKTDEPPVCPSPKKNATKAKATKKRQAKRKSVPAEEPAAVARSGLAISVPHTETGRSSRYEPRRAEMSVSMHAEPAARVTSSSRAPHSPITPVPQPDTVAVPSQPTTTMPSVSIHAAPVHDQTMSTDAFASGRPAWVPVHDPHMPPDADAGWTPSTAPPNRAPSPSPAPARAESEEPRATEEQVRTAVAIIADISKKHKERWAEVNAFEECVERACRSAANLRTLVRQERAQRIRMHDYLAYWNPGVGSEWKDEEIWDRVRPTRFDEEGCEVEVLSDDEDAFREQFPL
ncbi:hypothetical protein C2E23DRAFT_561642 [Lenzites betulinus]|nr:hypothetical protein C2E23DRAFT_561642 [Lenzites betulinus]